MLCECRDTCFMGHFGLRTRWKHSCLRLTELEAKVRSRAGQMRLSFQTQYFFILKHAYPVQFCHMIKKCHLFWCTTIKNAKKSLQIWKNLFRHYTETYALRSTSFPLQDVLTERNQLISKPLHWFSSLSVINFGLISGRIKSVCIGLACSPD